ncbi:MAG: TOBE domain-containing protein [Gammaproteobacteria bacterium]|nr:TOBE domain-containing protein [Gammaproteobacteria bacterium]MBI5618360.1 TOBE domain-containing protein [Gammaproteobacteria bacterium]
MKSSIRNKLAGKIVDIIAGEAMSEIDVKTKAGIISAAITTRSLKELALKKGDKVTVGMKSTAVFVEKE